MSIAPPIRIRRTRPSLGSAPATTPKPKGPSKPPKPPVPAPAPAPVQPVARSKPPSVATPKGPAQTPPKPRPLPVRVEHPQRLRAGRQARQTPGIFVGGWAWGSPFRVREVEGRWSVVWTGDERGLGRYRPKDWQDIPCETRPETAQLAQEAFRDWITSKPLADVLDHARRILRGYNLVCPCPLGYPCHATVLLELVNRAENKS